MDTRTYRVQVAGQFDRPATAAREKLLAEQPEHDYTLSAFSPDGTFTYSTALTRFTLRYLIDIAAESAVEADAEAVLSGEIRAIDFLTARDIPYKALDTTMTCLQDVKVRR
jgi:hypothetical protein